MSYTVICPKCQVEIAEIVEIPKYGQPITPENFKNMRQIIRPGKSTVCDECGNLWYWNGNTYTKEKGWINSR